MSRKKTQEIGASGFQSYLTEEGIVSITDSAKMSILGELANGDKTLADLSRTLNIPLSTLFSNLSKMVDRGLVISYGSSDDNRKILYSLIAMKLIESVEPDPSFDEPLTDVLGKAVSDPGYFYRSIVTFVNFYSSKIGLDMGPVMEKTGATLATVMKDDLRSDKVEEIIPKLKTYAIKAHLPDITVFTFVPLTIIMQLDYGTTSKPDNLFKLTMGFVMQALSDHTGLSYRTSNAEVFGSDNSKFKFVLEPESGMDEKFSKTVMGYETMSVKFDDSAEYFELYATDRGMIYNSNMTQICILDKLRISPYTLSELSRDLGISQSTVFSNLNKMLDSGLIAISDNQIDNRKVLYKPTSVRILTQKSPVKGAEKKAYAAMVRATKNPETFFRSLFDFLSYGCDIIGLDLSDSARLVGSEYAKAVKENNSDCKIEGIMDKICKNSDMIGAESVTLMTYIPMTIVLSCYLDNDKSVSKMVSSFYQGFFSELISLTTDIPYVVLSSEEVREDRIVHKYVFEASNVRTVS